MLIWAVAARTAGADQILDLRPSSFAQTLPAATGAQDLQPGPWQRGVLPDGSLLQGTSHALAIAGNPLAGSGASARFLQDIDLATGAVALTEVDLALPARVPWIIGRSYTTGQRSSAGARDSNGYQGWNWSQLSQPALVADNAATPTVIYVVYGADRYIEFRSYSSTVFRGVNGAAGALELTTSGSTAVVKYHDQTGHVAWFFGLQVSGVAGQLWKVEDAAGGVAYAGHATDAAAAITQGYSSGKITTAYDSAGRRFTYTYQTISGDTTARLFSVVAEAPGGSWTEVGRVEYEYYTAAGSNGNIGDLRLARVTMPQSVAGADDVRRSYFRYYQGPWQNTDGQRGSSHMLRMVLGPEGCRRFDWATGGTMDASLADANSATDATLKPYTDEYFEYISAADRRVQKAWFDGEPLGLYQLTYTPNGSPPDPGNSTYETAWLSRTTVHEPFKWCTHYFDEAFQHLSTAYADTDPPTQNTWVYKVERDAGARIIRVGTPASVVDYNHGTGEIPLRTNDGLIFEIGRIASGDFTGFVQTVRHRRGTAFPGDVVPHDVWVSYWAGSGGQHVPEKNIGGFRIVRPLISAIRTYPTETGNPNDAGYNQTTLTYELYGADGYPLTARKVTTALPAISVAHHGPNLQHTSAIWLERNGDPTFSRSVSGKIGYRNFAPLSGERDDGLLRWSVTDANTTRLSDGGITIPSGFSTQGTGAFHLRTDVEHDPQGRTTALTRPGNRRVKATYTRLADHRLVGIYLPRAIEGGTPKYYGPATCRVYNHAGGVEESAIIAVPFVGGQGPGWTSTAPTAWINTTAASIVAAVNSPLTLGTLTSSFYSQSGARYISSRHYTDIYAPGGAQYDTTTISYDSAQRLTDITDPTCTITHFNYDTLDRVTSVQRSVCGTRTTPLDIAQIQYDGGLAGGNSYVTRRTGNANIPQTTDFDNDYQGRPHAVKFGEAPHLLADYNNLGQITAAGLYGGDGSLLNAGLSPLTYPDGRQFLMQQSFDERNQIYTQSLFDPAAGTGGSSINTNLWYSADGHLLLSQGATIEKYEYDRLCRQIVQYTLASTTTSSYGTVTLQTSDIVLREQHICYDAVLGLPRFTATVERNPDVCGDTPWPGRLTPTDFMQPTPPSPTLNPDTDLLAIAYFPPPGMHGKPDIWEHWYDEIDWNKVICGIGDTKMPFPASPNSPYTPGLDPSQYKCCYYPLPYAPPRHRDTGPIWVQDYDPSGNPFSEYGPTGIPKKTTWDNGPRPTKIEFPGICAGDCDIPEGSEPDPCGGQRLLEIIYAQGRVTETVLSFPIVEGGGIDLPSEPNGPNGPEGPQYPTGQGPGLQRQSTRYFYRDTIPAGALSTYFPISDIADNNLVLAVALPDSPGIPPSWSDTYRYGYNRQGQPTGMRDPGGNAFAITRDARGRMTRQSVTPATGYDARVRAREIAYGWLGAPALFTSKDAQDTIVDQADVQRDQWGNITRWRMDPDSALPRDISTMEFNYTWQLRHPNGAGGGSQGWQQFIRQDAYFPGNLHIFPNSGGTCSNNNIDEYLCRVSQIQLQLGTGPSNPVAVYGVANANIPPYQGTSYRFNEDAGYFGIYKPSRVRLPQPQVVDPFFDTRGIKPDYNQPSIGNGLDWLGRNDSDSWYRYFATAGTSWPALDAEKHSWDVASRLTGGIDITVPGFGSKAGYSCQDDIIYYCQGANPVEPGGYHASGSNARTEQWNLADLRRESTSDPIPSAALDRSGNFGRYWFDSDGDAMYDKPADLEVAGGFNEANEAQQYDARAGSGATVSTAPLHDANGNLVDDGAKFIFRYDPFGHLVQVNRRNANGTTGLLFAKFTYNALGYRTSAVYDLFPLDEDTGQPAGDGDLCNDNLDWYIYNEAWQLVAVYRQGPGSGEGCTRPTARLYERYVYHAAGIGGASNSYGPDHVVLRHRDTASPLGEITSADETVYYLQNRRGDVRAITTSAGKPLAYVRYSAYGVPYLLRVADYDQDLKVDSSDWNSFLNAYFNSSPSADINKDGLVNSQDFFDFLGDFNDQPVSAGRGVLSTAALDNHIGYAGYWWDPYLKVYHVRNRVYDPARGRWLQRDPIGYAGGFNLYQYCGGDPLGFTDPFGLEPPDGTDHRDWGLHGNSSFSWAYFLPWSDQRAVNIASDGQVSRHVPLPAPTARDARNAVLEHERDENGNYIDELNDKYWHRLDARYGQGYQDAVLGDITVLGRRIHVGMVVVANFVPAVGNIIAVGDFIEDPSLENGVWLVAGLAGDGAATLKFVGAASDIEHGGAAAAKGTNRRVLKKGEVTYTDVVGVCFAEGTLVATADGQRRIENLRVGDRVLTSDDAAADDGVRYDDWLEVQLAMPNPEGWDDIIELVLLRPRSWVESVGAEPGGWIEFGLPEMGVFGEAKVLSVAPSPSISKGPGRVVLATLTHSNSEVLAIEFRGTSGVLEPTARHRLFSMDRNDWIAASDLKAGECVRTRDGSLEVTSVRARWGSYRVYNIEVASAHSYFVSPDFLLSHNDNPCAAKTGPRAWPTGPHNRTIAKRIQEIKLKLGDDWEHVGGGKLTEHIIETPNGKKTYRRMDITFYNKKTGAYYHEQVGATYTNGEPVRREVDAMNDVECATGERPHFTPYK